MKATAIRFKDSADVKVGCLRPHMIRMLEAILITAPETKDGFVWVTEAWRLPRHPDDAHTWCNAWDIRSKNVQTDNLKIAMQLWVNRARGELNGETEYQFHVHGEGAALHMHAEYDPR